MTTEEPSRSSFTPTLGRNPRTCPPVQVTPQCGRDNGFATMINMNRLRELTAELGFIPATTDAAAIDGRERQLTPR